VLVFKVDSFVVGVFSYSFLLLLIKLWFICAKSTHEAKYKNKGSLDNELCGKADGGLICGWFRVKRHASLKNVSEKQTRHNAQKGN
jgi:hypothetical protein